MEQDTNIKNIYGQCPPEMMRLPAGVQQFSPLLPGSLALEECAESSLDSMAMLAPYGTIERRYALALALRALVPGAQLIAMAPKDKGGARVKKELHSFGCDVVEDARRHFRICHAVRPDQITGLDEALANGAPRLIKEIGFWSQPGIFSWDRPDPGSVLLMKTLPVLSGCGADLGCGMGYLSRGVLTSKDIQHLALIDIDRRAMDCARRNIEDKRASFLWADINVSSDTLKNLDFVIMNPPFHKVGIENQALGQKFIERAHAILSKEGVCWLTANRHLPYEDLLGKLYKKVTLKAEADGYKIYEAVK